MSLVPVDQASLTQLSEIRGVVTDPASTDGSPPSGVASLSIVLSRDAGTTGEYWAQGAWHAYGQSSVNPSVPITLSAPDAGGQIAWAYPALLPSGSQLTLGQYYVRADVSDNAGNPNARIHLFRINSALRARFYPSWPMRMVGGVFQGSGDGTSWTDLATISTEPPANTYSDVSLGQAPFRYLRYVGPPGSHCNISELEFYFGPTRLIGRGFGSPGSYMDTGRTFDKALDGIINTYFDAPDGGSGYFVGVDTASGTPLLGSWLVGPGIAMPTVIENGVGVVRGIRYPNQVVGQTARSGEIRRLNAYSATDFDLWTRDVAGVAKTSLVPDVCSYTWSASAGTFPDGPTGTTANWQAPTVAQTTNVTLTLTVTDQAGANKGLAEAGARTGSPQSAGDAPVQFTVQVTVNP